MPRKCSCSGGACRSANTVTRRGFLTLFGAGGAAAAMGGPAWAKWIGQQATTEDLAAWKADLLKPTRPRIYASDVHTDARMHLGGIGTGNLEIGVDGQLTTWQLFNTLRDGEVPLCFGVQTGGVARLLQTTGGPDWPRMKRSQMVGEYPISTLRFEDNSLPVQVEMEAFSPFAPLDTHLSSMPVAVFVLRVKNPGRTRRKVSLAAFCQNPVGYEAIGTVKGNHHVGFGGNFNEAATEGNASVVVMRAEQAPAHNLAAPLRVHTNVSLGALNAPPNDRPGRMTVVGLDGLPAIAADAKHSMIWLEDAPSAIGGAQMKAIAASVRAGATLVIAGTDSSLLRDYAATSAGQPIDLTRLRPDVVFEDFEQGYDRWTVEGQAFSTAPARGTLPGQQAVSGFGGKRLVNSFYGGDDTTGKLTSREFTIDRRFICFLVGGGSHAGTQIRLVVDGKVVRATSGRDHEQLDPELWNVADLAGRQAHIEIVDAEKGPWGHINVDNIVFSDLPGGADALQELDNLVPVRFSDIRPVEGGRRPAIDLVGATQITGARVVDSPIGLRVWSRTLGTGRVLLVGGRLIDPSEAGMSGARREAWAALCTLAGVPAPSTSDVNEKAPGFGELALATMGPAPSAKLGFADWNDAWAQFAAEGSFAPFSAESHSKPTSPHETSSCALATTITIAGKRTVEVPFVVAWRYPNKYFGQTWVGNYYATQWKDARAVIHEVAANLEDIRSKTERFRNTFYDSTLPYWLLDCVTSQMSILRHIGVVFRIANGDIYGWEGSNGCCQPTCTHVWGYEQALAHTFPDLEREMRRIDFRHQQRADGGINNRTDVPSPAHPTGEQPFADGHPSCILKAYREALDCNDEAWLRDYWPYVRKAVDYLIGRDAAGSGGSPDGTLKDDQWNTYDNAIHGVNTFIGTYYLAALRAGEEWAKRVGDKATATRFHDVFEKGQRKLVEMCWNGEYFQQNLPGYLQRSGEYGPGCLSDQLIGQWWAHQLGLGYLLPKEKVQTALRSIFRYNWLPDHTTWTHNWRKFAGGKDKGLLICTWPKGGRPAETIPYVDEVWTGVEYQVAAHMLYEGMVEEAFAIVKGARDRYDGVPRQPISRNPWNEIECGGHYARAMSSWSLLLAITGWEYDGPARRLRMAPLVKPENFRAFYCATDGWGRMKQLRKGSSQRNELYVAEGQLELSELQVKCVSVPKACRVTIAGRSLPTKMTVDGDTAKIVMEPRVVVLKGQTLVVSLT